MDTSGVAKAMATAFLVLMHHQYTRLITKVVREEEIRAYLTLLELQSHFGDNPIKFQVVCPQIGTAVLEGLSALDGDEVQDDLDGVGASLGRQTIPMEERFWERVGRYMPSANVRTLFRCT